MDRSQDIEGPFAPGTIRLERAGLSPGSGDGHLILQPQPSEDPNDPLNWSKWRKFVNFSILCFYSLIIFTILDIGGVAYQSYISELGMTWGELNITFAANCAGLAVGCIIFIPFSLKYGRRPVYIVSTIITFGMSVWQAKLNSYGEMVATQVISGLSGAVSETLVQMTVMDMFFIHQRGTMNGIYLVMVAIGSFLGPVASGLIAFSEGWRWMYGWTSILLGVNVILFIFFYEETKYVPKPRIESPVTPSNATQSTIETNPTEPKGENRTSQNLTSATYPFKGVNHDIPMKSRRERLAFTTTTKSPFSMIFRHMWQPFVILVTIPAVAYCAVQYGSLLAWFSVIFQSESEYFILPPYNFNEIGIGLLSLPAFIGCIVGFIWGGPLSDWSIIWLTKRNNGIYEPEMRLYLAIFPALIGPVGLFLYGYGTAAGMDWIIPCIGVGIFGFSVTALGDTSLTYLSDSYREILGDALVGIAFVRNLAAAAVVFAQDPWTQAIGLRGLFTCIGCISIGFNILIIPLTIWGKKFRIKCAKRYARLAERQFDPRAI
ncbi:major facilitator superfamily domain-containing protein [Tricladium varicosporioides]|nr:major facilitator superfamily domain-containing protein [Hymenoscyphus varicosporioides]